MDGHRKKLPPDGNQTDQGNRPTPVNSEEIAPSDGEDVAEQIAHQIDPHPFEEGETDQPEGERAMGEQAEQCVGGEGLLALGKP